MRQLANFVLLVVAFIASETLAALVGVATSGLQALHPVADSPSSEVLLFLAASVSWFPSIILASIVAGVLHRTNALSSSAAGAFGLVVLAGYLVSYRPSTSFAWDGPTQFAVVLSAAVLAALFAASYFLVTRGRERTSPAG